MTPITREWVTKAEGDCDVVTTLLRSRKRSRYDAICFHAQQCAEKYLKAYLTEQGQPFPKTHDLTALLALALPTQAKWSTLAGPLSDLSAFAVLPRYPGMTSTGKDARAAVAICRRLQSRTRIALGL